MFYFFIFLAIISQSDLLRDSKKVEIIKLYFKEETNLILVFFRFLFYFIWFYFIFKGRGTFNEGL